MSQPVVLFPDSAQVTQVRPQCVPVGCFQRVVLGDILHIVDCCIQLVFVEMPARHLPIEVRQMLLRIFVPIRLGPVVPPLEIGRPP